MSPEIIRATIERLEAGEAVSVLIGDGPRPSELKLAGRPQARIRAALIADLSAQLPPDEPQSAPMGATAKEA